MQSNYGLISYLRGMMCRLQVDCDQAVRSQLSWESGDTTQDKHSNLIRSMMKPIEINRKIRPILLIDSK